MRASISTWSTGLVEHRDEAADFRHLGRDVDDQQRVGATVEADAAAGREETALAGGCTATAAAVLAFLGQHLRDVFGVAVVHRDVTR
jgi:hypothetical protein